MGRYAKVFRTIWQDDDFRALSMTAQWLYVALISQEDTSPCGVLPIIERRWAGYASDASRDTISTALDELAEARFVVVDDDTAEVWIRSYIARDEMYANGPNGRKAVDNSIGRVLSPRLARMATESLAAATKHQVDRPDEAPSVAPPQAPELGGSEAQQLATSNLQPSTSSKQPREICATTSDHIDPNAAAAASQAIEILIAHRIRTTPNVHNPGGLRRKLQHDLPAEWGDAILAYTDAHPTAAAADICEHVLGLGELDIFAARKELAQWTA